MNRSLSHYAAAMAGVLHGDDASFTAVSTDSRSIAAGELFVALSGPNFDGHDFVATAVARGAAGVVVTRRMAVDVPQIVVADTLRALQDAAAAWRTQFPIPVVAVAGSNGKTTTKEMIAAILSAHGPCLSTRGTLNNHIGVPLTLLRLDRQHATAVIEIGANHPGEVAALMPLVQPTVGIVTNAGAEHLEGFGDLEGVARAEGELFAGLHSGATAVINVDDPYAPLWRSMSVATRELGFGLAANADFRLDGEVQSSGPAGSVQEFQMATPAGATIVRLGLAGRHNVQNALGAAAAAFAVGANIDGVDVASIAAGLGRMQPVRGRLEVKLAPSGARVIDDSYNANPSSLSAGLDVLATQSGERWLVLGDMAELGEAAAEAHRAAGREARGAGVSRLFAVGSLTADAVREFGDGAEWFGDSDALATRVAPLLRHDVTVLVKGSRVNRLERVVAALATAVGEGR
ncbi:MAG: UDP-N-acetylmuramoyl-tripeptide--D-alanyl-D-alanine ligase [Proteobacteria bacterium]|nr:UDP-N-acetylmuramoyl-tripeptide--D-alanyl-D-alanine ligase [Pseudomonadota bacterium]